MKYHVMANGQLRDISLSTLKTYNVYATFDNLQFAEAWARDLLMPWFIIGEAADGCVTLY